MTTYRTLAFNWCVWLQTLLSFVFTKLVNTLLRLNSHHPTDPKWIASLLAKKFDQYPPIAAVERSAETLPGGGLVGQTYRIELKFVASDVSPPAFPRSLVVKQSKECFRGRLASTFFQTGREALFYEKLVPNYSILASCVPQVYYSHGSLLAGEFTIVMEDLTGDAVPASHLLGNQCWGAVSLPDELQNVAPLQVFRMIFSKMAEIHAAFWRDESLLKKTWMRGVAWRTGGGKWSWQASFDNTRARWTALSSTSNIFTSLQRETIQCLLMRTRWSTWQRHNNVVDRDFSKKFPWTLVHGDFHAGNVLWKVENTDNRAVFVDWSEVGIGCPFTELAQFMISNAPIEFRRQNERQLFDEYYSHLVELGVEAADFPREECWNRYKAGGIERWLQLLVLLAAAGIPEFALRWFSGQVESFLKDHSSSIPKCFNSVYCLPHVWPSTRKGQ